MPTVRSDDQAGGVRVLTLDRPPANALDETLLGDLQTALEAAAADDSVRALVLRGAGAFVSGGFDLAAPRRDAAAARRLAALYRDAHLALLAFPKPTVAFLHGHAVAGGLILVLACDYRLGAEGDHRVGLNELAIGASFPRVALEIVRLRLPHARAAELLLGAALYPASQALRLGVVDELLPADTAEATVLRRAGRLGAFPRDAYAHTKAALVADAVAHTRAETPAEAAAAAGGGPRREPRGPRRAAAPARDRLS
ncbi:MAG: enoyl-CoA hydratase/isomerase family protein [bacterium]|nr:enoyl-CoA hydratase/isomerase family protein [bacterium]